MPPSIHRPRNRAALAVGAVALALVGAACSGPTPPAAPAPAPGASTAPVPAVAAGPELDQPLIDAAARGDAAAVRDLLGRGAQVTVRDDRGASALVRAAYGNHLEAAGLLIAAGADVNAVDDTVQSAYLISTSEVGDDPRLLELALAAGADVNAKDSYHGTGLIRAAERGHPTIVSRLLDAGIDRDHINRLGLTALHEAVVFGDGGPAHQATVRALVRGGVALDIPDGRGVRALAHADRLGQREVAAILRAAGAT